MGFFTEPALRLIDEAILVVIDAHRTDGAFAEVEDLVTRRRALAGDGGGLVVAIKMVLVLAVAELNAFQQLLGDVRIPSGREEGGEPVESREDAVLHRVLR